MEQDQSDERARRREMARRSQKRKLDNRASTLSRLIIGTHAVSSYGFVSGLFQLQAGGLSIYCAILGFCISLVGLWVQWNKPEKRQSISAAASLASFVLGLLVSPWALIVSPIGVIATSLLMRTYTQLRPLNGPVSTAPGAA